MNKNVVVTFSTLSVLVAGNGKGGVFLGRRRGRVRDLVYPLSPALDVRVLGAIFPRDENGGRRGAKPLLPEQVYIAHSLRKGSRLLRLGPQPKPRSGSKPLSRGMKTFFYQDFPEGLITDILPLSISPNMAERVLVATTTEICLLEWKSSGDVSRKCRKIHLGWDIKEVVPTFTPITEEGSILVNIRSPSDGGRILQSLDLAPLLSRELALHLSWEEVKTHCALKRLPGVFRRTLTLQ